MRAKLQPNWAKQICCLEHPRTIVDSRLNLDPLWLHLANIFQKIPYIPFIKGDSYPAKFRTDFDIRWAQQFLKGELSYENQKKCFIMAWVRSVFLKLADLSKS